MARPRGGRRVAGRRLPRGAAVLALAAALPGCVSEERELALGEQIAFQINAQLPLVQDAAVNRYVTTLGRSIAAESDRPHLEYHFYIVDTPAMNAFALPGGHVYVNRGLVERTRSSSELAGVLAHEIAHVAARHGARNLQRQLRTRSMAATMYHLILNRRPLLDQEALDLGGALWHASHSRRAEVEADRLAVRYLVDAGVDPRGMLSLFGALLEAERRAGEGPQVGWFATHPGTDRRIQATREKIGQVVPPEGHGALAGDDIGFRRFHARLRALPRAIAGPILVPPGHPHTTR